ncbi:hypothetical protein [Pseudomonas aeruginosa]|uniref:hypothetical protein n=1 Tax=Pseudomonas aeruginosa TaxID=287 RepID=UPI003D9C9442
MRYINYLLIAVTSGLCATYSVLWLTKPSPLESTTIPPLTVHATQEEIVVWGGWKAIEGYQHPGANAVEVRCNRALGTCNEALATILHHTEGEDLEAQVFNYQIIRWDESNIEAVAARSMGLCLERRLVISVRDRTAALSWSPPAGCEADKGRAVLVGDPL